MEVFRVKNSWKQYQIERSIVDCCTSLELFLKTPCQTIQLLGLILPVGWKISNLDKDNIRHIERNFQVHPNQLNNVYTTLRNNKVHVHNFYPADFNKDFVTVRINLTIDRFDRVLLI